MTPAVDLALGIILCLIFLVGLVSSLVTERRNRMVILERLQRPDPPARPLPFIPIECDPSDLGTTQSGGVCPTGASAPKTVRPGSLYARLMDRDLVA